MAYMGYELAEVQTVLDTLRQSMSENITVGSYSIQGRSVSYNSLQDMRDQYSYYLDIERGCLGIKNVAVAAFY
jgi:hypothetical protein